MVQKVLHDDGKGLAVVFCLANVLYRSSWIAFPPASLRFRPSVLAGFKWGRYISLCSRSRGRGQEKE